MRPSPRLWMSFISAVPIVVGAAAPAHALPGLCKDVCNGSTDCQAACISELCAVPQSGDQCRHFLTTCGEAGKVIECNSPEQLSNSDFSTADPTTLIDSDCFDFCEDNQGSMCTTRGGWIIFCPSNDLSSGTSEGSCPSSFGSDSGGTGQLTIRNPDGSISAECTAPLVTPQFFVVPAACIGNKAEMHDDARTWATWVSTPDGIFWNGPTASEVQIIVNIGSGLAVGRLREPVPGAVRSLSLPSPYIHPYDIGATPLSTGERIYVAGFGVGPGFGQSCLKRLADSIDVNGFTSVHDTWGGVHNLPSPNDVYRERGAVAVADSDGTLRAIATGGSASGWVDLAAQRERIFAAVRSLDMGMEKGVDRAGFDLPGSPIITTNDVDCRNACERTPDCAAFSYVRTSQQCWLKSVLATPRANSASNRFLSDVTSGVPRERGSYSIGGGAFVSSTRTTSVEACETFAAGVPGAADFVWDTTTGDCLATNPMSSSAQPKVPGTATSGARAGQFRPERNINRGGWDVNHLTVSSESACAAECVKDNRCRSWTFVVSKTNASSGTCWLKSLTPDPTVASDPNNNLISGVRRGIDYNTDRRGGDASPGRNFDLSGSSPELCQTECEKDSNCKAWAMRVAAGGLSNHCWLKSSVPAQQFGVMGIHSGVKGGWKY